MTTTAAILQSNYIPWKGYFDLIRAVDVFVFLDDVQYTKNDWRNRNQIKTSHGLVWLTIPVGGDLNRRICDVEVADQRWRRKHRTSIEHAYGKTPYFSEYGSLLDELYGGEVTNLSDYNQATIARLCEVLGIETQLLDSRDLPQPEGRTERLIGMLQAVGADAYLSGPAARGYIDIALFDAAGISCRFVDYGGYPEYPQLHGDFVHGVSVLDLIYNTGPDAVSYLQDL